jgi:hypothetical protein
LAEPIDDYDITEHAVFEMGRRRIDESAVRHVLTSVTPFGRGATYCSRGS